jgi:NhaA family Na+:H+ antiporter
MSKLNDSRKYASEVVSEFSFALLGYREEEAPLHVFERMMKVPVDFGMFFFGLANAGVSFGSVGGVTVSVVVALLVGKTAGIVACSGLAVCLGFGLPEGLEMLDLVLMGMLAGVGLTVCLFVANEAFVDPELQGQAKMGAVISVGFGALAYFLRRVVFGRKAGVFIPAESADDVVEVEEVQQE